MKAPAAVRSFPVDVRWSSNHRARWLSNPREPRNGCVSSQPVARTSNKMTTNAGTSRLARDTALSLHYAPPDEADPAADGAPDPPGLRAGASTSRSDADLT